MEESNQAKPKGRKLKQTSKFEIPEKVSCKYCLCDPINKTNLGKHVSEFHAFAYEKKKSVLNYIAQPG